ncbi:MAG: inositol monophosphatase [Chloroflexi bacterium]|nr:inositol monophosphatase [Chloroflexota bacterium]
MTGGSAWAAEQAFAIETAAAAGAILMDRYERLEQIDHKSARDVVTEADHLSEELVIAAIRDRFPGDAILAEESGAHPAASLPVNGRIWVIDPLDGTVNYANGLPVFCVSIGVVVNGWPVAGAVFDPTRAETFAATADGPATLNGRVIRASSKEKLSDGVISLSLAGRSVATRARAIRKEIRIARSMGSAALGIAYVANGRFDAFVQESGLSAWDVAAAGLIAERAGATVTAFDGSAWYDPGRGSSAAGSIAGPAAFHARLLALANQRQGRGPWPGQPG